MVRFQLRRALGLTVALGLCGTMANAQTARFSLTPSQTMAKVGDLITYSLIGSNIGGSAAWETKIRLDTSYLAFTSNFSNNLPFANGQASFFSDQLIDTLLNNGGTLALGFGNPSLAGYAGNGDVSLGTFQVQVMQNLAGAPGQSRPITIGAVGVDSNLLDGNGTQLLSSVSGATLSAPTTTAAPEMGTLSLLLGGTVILGGIVRKRRAF